MNQGALADYLLETRLSRQPSVFAHPQHETAEAESPGEDKYLVFFICSRLRSLTHPINCVCVCHGAYANVWVCVFVCVRAASLIFSLYHSSITNLFLAA